MTKFKGIHQSGLCVLCGKPLHPNKIVWLEADIGFERFYAVDANALKPEESMGCFEFGPACAKKLLGRPYSGK